jgi:hypothetical protein
LLGGIRPGRVRDRELAGEVVHAQVEHALHSAAGDIRAGP